MKKRLWLGVLVVIILGGIGGKMYMDKREEDLQELLEIQKDLANYVYNNYRLYTTNDKETDKFTQQYSNGELTTEEYVEKVVSVRKYIDINKIEFTGYSISPMNFLEVHFNLNNSNKHIATLGVKSAETNKWRYNVDIGRKKTEDKYFIEVREFPNGIETPTEIIEYYYGGL